MPRLLPITGNNLQQNDKNANKNRNKFSDFIKTTSTDVPEALSGSKQLLKIVIKLS